MFSRIQMCEAHIKPSKSLDYGNAWRKRIFGINKKLTFTTEILFTSHRIFFVVVETVWCAFKNWCIVNFSQIVCIFIIHTRVTFSSLALDNNRGKLFVVFAKRCNKTHLKNEFYARILKAHISFDNAIKWRSYAKRYWNWFPPRARARTMPSHL